MTKSSSTECFASILPKKYVFLQTNDFDQFLWLKTEAEV